MKRQRYTKRQVAIARAAMQEGITVRAISRQMKIPMTVLYNWSCGDGHAHIKPDADFPRRLRAAFGAAA